MNQIIITGRLTKDAVHSTVAGDKIVTNFDIARNYEVKENSRTDYYSVSAWNGAATLTKDLKKGTLITVIGQPQQIKWEGRDGDNRVTFSILANTVLLNLTYPKKEGENSEPVKETAEVAEAVE